MYSAQGYQADFVLGTTSIKNELLKEKIIDNLNTTFLPYIFRGTENDMFKVGSRRTLNALSMIYYRQFIEDKANIRATLLKYIWTFGSETSCNSIGRISEAFPKSTQESLSAAKYAALSAVWAMELLEPNSTLFEGLPIGENKPGLSIITSKPAGSTISLSIRATNNLPENENEVWIDLNNNGLEDEGEKVTKFGEKVDYILNSNIIDIHGPIWTFDCSNNEIVDFKIYTAYSTLNQLSCYKNNLDTLDLSKCKKLNTVSCQNNQLKSIKINNAENLSRINMYSNQLNLNSMSDLVNSLPDRSNKEAGSLVLYYSVNSATQQNQNQLSEYHSRILEKTGNPCSYSSNTEFTGPYIANVNSILYDNVITRREQTCM